LQDQFGVRWAIVTRTGKLRLISVWQDGDVWVLMVWLVLLVISSLITLSYHCLCTGTELVLLIHLMLMLETGMCWNDCFRRIFSERELMFMFAICRRPSVCLSSVCRLSVICLSSVCHLSVCNVRAPYSADWNFWQCFCAIWYVDDVTTSR